MTKIVIILFGFMITISHLNASDLFTCKAIGIVDINKKKFVKATQEAYIKITPSQKRNYIYYEITNLGKSEPTYTSFKDGNFKYYWIEGGYVGFNENDLSAVLLSQEMIIIYNNCIKSDSIDAFSKEAEGLLNAAEDARHINDAMKTY